MQSQHNQQRGRSDNSNDINSRNTATAATTSSSSPAEIATKHKIARRLELLETRFQKTTTHPAGTASLAFNDGMTMTDSFTANEAAFSSRHRGSGNTASKSPATSQSLYHQQQQQQSTTSTTGFSSPLTDVIDHPDGSQHSFGFMSETGGSNLGMFHGTGTTSSGQLSTPRGGGGAPTTEQVEGALMTNDNTNTTLIANNMTAGTLANPTSSNAAAAAAHGAMSNHSTSAIVERMAQEHIDRLRMMSSSASLHNNNSNKFSGNSLGIKDKTDNSNNAEDRHRLETMDDHHSEHDKENNGIAATASEDAYDDALVIPATQDTDCYSVRSGTSAATTNKALFHKATGGGDKSYASTPLEELLSSSSKKHQSGSTPPPRQRQKRNQSNNKSTCPSNNDDHDDDDDVIDSPMSSAEQNNRPKSAPPPPSTTRRATRSSTTTSNTPVVSNSRTLRTGAKRSLETSITAAAEESHTTDAHGVIVPSESKQRASTTSRGRKSTPVKRQIVSVADSSGNSKQEANGSGSMNSNHQGGAVPKKKQRSSSLATTATTNTKSSKKEAFKMAAPSQQYTPLDIQEKGTGKTLTTTKSSSPSQSSPNTTAEKAPQDPLKKHGESTKVSSPINDNQLDHQASRNNTVKRVSPSTSHKKKHNNNHKKGHSSSLGEHDMMVNDASPPSNNCNSNSSSNHSHVSTNNTVKIKSPLRLSSPSSTSRTGGAGSSSQPGRSSTSGKNNNNKGSSNVPPTTTLHNFFKTTTSFKTTNKNTVVNGLSKGGAKRSIYSSSNQNADNTATGVSHTVVGTSTGLSVGGTTGIAASTNSATANNTSVSSAQLESVREEYEAKIAALEASLKEKSDQLSTIQHNRSMVYASLKTALDQKEGQLREKDRLWKIRQQKVSDTLEELLRTQLKRQNVELRQQVAQDTARLGRFVLTRTGYAGSMETWEHGHAALALKQERKVLAEERQILEVRYKDAKKASRRILTATAQTQKKHPQPPNHHPSLATDDSATMPPPAAPESMIVGGLEIRNELDAMEAEESAKRQLNELCIREAKISEQERALNIEISTHVRHMKRVANEDSSRFGQSHHPKLHDRYLPMKLLGKGGFSEVWQAYDLVELREVAVKVHQIDPRWSSAKRESYTKHVSREYQIHRNARHPRIVSLYDVFEIDNHSFATVLECCQGNPTDLDMLLKERKYLKESDARAILLQILEGMRYLASGDNSNGSNSSGSSSDNDNNGAYGGGGSSTSSSSSQKKQPIIHYDLKPGNILFDANGDAKITDFGLSKIVDTADSSDSMELTSQGAGTYWYLPPECFFSGQNIRISNKVDVWSLGVIYYQMVFGKRPFGDGQSQDHVLSGGIMLNAREVKFPSSNNGPRVSDGCKEFIQAALTYDQTFRPSIAELCQHPYLFQKKL